MNDARREEIRRVLMLIEEAKGILEMVRNERSLPEELSKDWN
jgi:hypothetical protein